MSHREVKPKREKEGRTGTQNVPAMAVLVFTGLAGWAKWEGFCNWYPMTQLSRRCVQWMVATSHSANQNSVWRHLFVQLCSNNFEKINEMDTFLAKCTYTYARGEEKVELAHY